MFCEYCGEIIKEGMTKCPCCGARISAHVGGDYSSDIPSASADDYYANLNTSLPASATQQPYSSSDEALNTVGMLRIDVIFMIVSMMFPVIGIFLGVIQLKKKKTVSGVICLVMGILHTLTFVLPFLFVVVVGIFDSIVIT